MTENNSTVTHDFAKALTYGDNVYISTVYPATTPANIEVIQETITDLQRSLQSALDMNSAQRRIINDYTYKIECVKTLIAESFENDSFGDAEDILNNIADALEIELTKDYQVTINVTFSGTVTLPLGVDIHDIENYVEFDASTNRYNDDVEIDLFADGVDVRVNDR